MALLAIGLMYASFIGIGWLASRKQAGGADEFMVAGAEYDTVRVSLAEEAGEIEYGNEAPF